MCSQPEVCGHVCEHTCQTAVFIETGSRNTHQATPVTSDLAVYPEWPSWSALTSQSSQQMSPLTQVTPRLRPRPQHCHCISKDAFAG